MVIISISTVQTYLGPINSLRPGLLLFVGATAALAYRPGSVDWSNLKRSWPVKAVCALVVLAVGSALFGISFGGSARFLVEGFVRILLPFFLTVVAIRNHHDLAFFIWGFVISVAILVVLSLTVLELDPVGGGGFARLGGVSTYDANDLGMIFLMGLPMAILLFLTSGTMGRIVCGVIIASIPMALALTGSRGGFVGLLAVAPALFLALDRVSLIKRIGVVVLVAVSLGLAAPEGYWDQMQTITQTEEDYNYTSEYGRKAIALRGLGYMLRHPFFGVGVGNFGRAEGTLSSIAVESYGMGGVRWIAPHNTYVQVGAEMGIFALSVWLTLIFGGILSLRKLREALPPSADPESRFLREACHFLPISVWAFAVTSFFLSHAYTTPTYTLFALMGGCIAVSRRRARSVARSPQVRTKGRVRRSTRALQSASQRYTA